MSMLKKELYGDTICTAQHTASPAYRLLSALGAVQPIRVSFGTTVNMKVVGTDRAIEKGLMTGIRALQVPVGDARIA